LYVSFGKVLTRCWHEPFAFCKLTFAIIPDDVGAALSRHEAVPRGLGD
jgi:hypothetical protein